MQTLIHGQVRYAQGQAAGQGIMILLERAVGGVVAQTQTDSQGKFSFRQIPQDTYTIKIHQAGYRDAFEQADLTIGPTANLMIELQPLPGTASPAVPAGGRISVQELSIPPDALKEIEQGQSLLEKNDAEKSISHFRKAVQLDASYAQAHLLLGTAYLFLNKCKEAQPALEKAIQLDDKLAAAHIALGACFNQQGNFAAGEKPLLRGLELNPDSPEGQYELGRTYWALGRWQEAEPHARRAIALRADYAAAHVLTGNILLRKRDAAGALREFQEYLRLEPAGPLAAPTREIVAKIEKALAARR